MTNKFVYY